MATLPFLGGGYVNGLVDYFTCNLIREMVGDLTGPQMWAAYLAGSLCGSLAMYAGNTVYLTAVNAANVAPLGFTKTAMTFDPSSIIKSWWDSR